ncbi:MAG: hypothetical protein U0T11_06370 [Chitinophagaceae bacterium]
MKHLFLLTSFLGISAAAICQNIGIGTSNPQYKLHLHSTGHTTFNITDGTTGDGPSVGGRIDMLTGNLSIFNYSGTLALGTMGKTAVYISSGIEGYVGINNSNPKAPLHISSSPDTNEGLRLSGATPFMSFYNGTTMHGYVQAASAGFELGSKSGMPLNIYTGNQQRLTILDNGNVGIGTSTPAYPFSMSLSLNSSGANVPLAYLKNTGTGGGLYSSVNNPATGPESFFPAAIAGHSVGYDAIIGKADGNGNGVSGRSENGSGVIGISQNGDGVVGYSSGSGSAAVLGQAFSIPAVGGYFNHTNGEVALQVNNGSIKVSGSKPTAFQVTATGTNSIIIPNTSQANSSTDMLFIQHKGVASNVNTPVYVKWDGANFRWVIYTESGGNIPSGEVFNVLVIKQ